MIVPTTKQCAGTVAVAETGITELIAVFGTGIADAGKEAVLHASAGALAFATLSVAMGFFSLALRRSSSVLIPGSRPCTVPLIAPGPLGARAEVTSWPFRRTVARRIAELGVAVTLIGNASPLATKIGSGAFRLVMV